MFIHPLCVGTTEMIAKYHTTAPFVACQYKLKFTRVKVFPWGLPACSKYRVKWYFPVLTGTFLFQDVVSTTTLISFLHTSQTMDYLPECEETGALKMFTSVSKTSTFPSPSSAPLLQPRDRSLPFSKHA